MKRVREVYARNRGVAVSIRVTVTASPGELSRDEVNEITAIAAEKSMLTITQLRYLHASLIDVRQR